VVIKDKGKKLKELIVSSSGFFPSFFSSLPFFFSYTRVAEETRRAWITWNIHSSLIRK